jgi:DNA-binding NarL/FixJ family response regulator
VTFISEPCGCCVADGAARPDPLLPGPVPVRRLVTPEMRRRIMELRALGLTVKVVAERLGLSVFTVKEIQREERKGND